MFITKATLLNVEYEFKSADRFLDLPTKDIVKELTLSDDDNLLNYTLNSTTSMDVTIGIKEKGNYIILESKIFKDVSKSGWFVNSITAVPNEEGYSANLSLDVIGTFGKDLFKQMENKTIEIERMHVDRYVKDNTRKDKILKINPDFKVPFAKSEFKLQQNQSGDRRIYDGAGVEVWDWESKILREDEIRSKVFPFKTIDGKYIDNHISFGTGGKKFYLYALMNLKGDPEIPLKAFPNDQNPAAAQTALVPVNIYEKNPPSGFIIDNNISQLQELQKDKIINIFYSPYKITPRLGKSIPAATGGTGKKTLHFLGDLSRSTDSSYGTGIITDESGFDVRIPRSEARISEKTDDDLLFMNYIYTQVEISTLKRNYESSNLNSFELMLLNDSISRMQFKIPGASLVPIDMFGLLFYPAVNSDKETYYFGGSFSYSEQGIETVLKISEQQYLQWTENYMVSFSSDVGATFLARNKYSIDAQKAGIDLQAQKDRSESKVRQAGVYGGGIIGGLLSSINPAQWVQSGILGQEVHPQITKIANNKKAQIDASIQDANATAPSIQLGATHTFSALNITEYKHKFNWILNKPSESMETRLLNYFNRFGYKIDSFIKFAPEMIQNRKEFNYFSATDVRDVLKTNSTIDIDIIELFNMELKKGVRLWHKEDIQYAKPNIEQALYDLLYPIPYLKKAKPDVFKARLKELRKKYPNINKK